MTTISQAARDAGEKLPWGHHVYPEVVARIIQDAIDAEKASETTSLRQQLEEALRELNEYKASDQIRTEREFANRDLLTEAASVILLARKALMANENTREGSEALNRGSIATSKFIASHPEFYP